VSGSVKTHTTAIGASLAFHSVMPWRTVCWMAAAALVLAIEMHTGGVLACVAAAATAASRDDSAPAATTFILVLV
jgi:membrane protein implicated in regulation of membrane protease activity